MSLVGRQKSHWSEMKVCLLYGRDYCDKKRCEFATLSHYFLLFPHCFPSQIDSL